MKKFILVMTMLPLAGCVTSGPPRTLSMPDAEAFGKAKVTLTESMKDPDSTRISDLKRVSSDSTDLVCGQVNSKNSFGGYTGKKPFAYSVDQDRVAVLGEGDLLTGNIWVTICMVGT